MNDERYKKIMNDLGMPNSRSLLQALQQVANEVEQETRASLETVCKIKLTAVDVEHGITIDTLPIEVELNVSNDEFIKLKNLFAATTIDLGDKLVRLSIVE